MLTDTLLREQNETSSGYWHKHKLEGALYSPNLGFQISIHEASFPYALKKLKVATIAMSLW